MSKTQLAQFSFNGKTLDVFCAVLHQGDLSLSTLTYAKEAFEKLAPYIRNDNQVLYIRDLPFLTIKGQWPGGHCYNSYEAMIALNNWTDNDNGQQIQATINHELHHMTRWQNAGYGDTLGSAILSEGMATYYEHLQSGWLAPWAQAQVSDKALEDALKAWDDTKYNHGEWFFSGPHGEWVAYDLGYRLAKEIFKDDFNLAMSIEIKAAEAKKYAMKLR